MIWAMKACPCHAFDKPCAVYAVVIIVFRNQLFVCHCIFLLLMNIALDALQCLEVKSTLKPKILLYPIILIQKRELVLLNH